MAKRQTVVDGVPALVALALGAAAAWAARDIPRADGRPKIGAATRRRADASASPQFADGKFRNTVPATRSTAASMPRLLAATLTDREAPPPAPADPGGHPGDRRRPDGLTSPGTATPPR